jgi:REP element-mobilizing transposase RayT
MPDWPVAYLVSFSCYGSHLHGDDGGSVDRWHNRPRGPLVEPNPGRREIEAARMSADAYRLDRPRRDAVLAAVAEACRHRGWPLLAAHVRETHVHVVVSAAVKPERVMNTLKAYASRRLNAMRIDARACPRWARHGSTRYLWDEKAVAQAACYVLHEQGEPMAAYDVAKDKEGGDAP